MFSAYIRAILVFVFFAFFALHAATGFLNDGDPYPSRARRALTGIIETFFTQPFGTTGGTLLLLALAVFCGWLAYRPGLRGAEGQ